MGAVNTVEGRVFDEGECGSQQTGRVRSDDGTKRNLEMHTNTKMDKDTTTDEDADAHCQCMKRNDSKSE